MKNMFYFLCLVSFSACSQQPQPIAYGKDACSACKMTLMDKKYGNEIITDKGKIYKFDDLVCMIAFLEKNSIDPGSAKQKLVIDFNRENIFIDAEQAVYYVDADLHSPMNGNAAAFPDNSEAEKFKNGKQGEIMGWEKVYTKLK